MPNGTYGGVRGKETKVGQKTFVSRPTRFYTHPIPVPPRTDKLQWEMTQATEWLDNVNPRCSSPGAYTNMKYQPRSG